jgi:hypothetical protein
MTGSGANSDFEMTNNPSVQNGGNLLYSEGANPLAPMFGVGLIPEVIGGPVPDFVVEMNRWVSQALLDGATLSRWSTKPVNGNNISMLTEVSYL